VPKGGTLEDPVLGRWVDRQRQYKKKRWTAASPARGGMMAERAAQLTALDFEWDRSMMGGITHVDAPPMAKYARYRIAGGNVYDPPPPKKR
jgi:hypothetical protein